MAMNEQNDFSVEGKITGSGGIMTSAQPETQSQTIDRLRRALKAQEALNREQADTILKQAKEIEELRESCYSIAEDLC